MADLGPSWAVMTQKNIIIAVVSAVAAATVLLVDRLHANKPSEGNAWQHAINTFVICYLKPYLNGVVSIAIKLAWWYITANQSEIF